MARATEKELRDFMAKARSQSRSKSKSRDGWVDFIQTAKGPKIRCQAMLTNSRPPKQCEHHAMTGKLVCKQHGGASNNIVLSREAETLKRNLGLYSMHKDAAMQKALREVEDVDPKILEGTADELKLAVAVLRQYLKRNSDEAVASRPERVMFLLDRIMNFKKLHWEITHADKVTFTKDQVEYMFIKVRGIITDVVKDTAQLKEISEKIYKMGMELRAQGFKVG